MRFEKVSSLFRALKLFPVAEMKFLNFPKNAKFIEISRSKRASKLVECEEEEFLLFVKLKV